MNQRQGLLVIGELGLVAGCLIAMAGCGTAMRMSAAGYRQMNTPAGNAMAYLMDAAANEVDKEQQRQHELEVARASRPQNTVVVNGQYHPAPGYAWVNQAQNDLRVYWAPGRAHPKWPNLIATEQEGSWRPAPGYVWRDEAAMRRGDWTVIPDPRHDAEEYYARANEALARENADEAIANANRIIDLFPSLPLGYNLRASGYLIRNDLASAARDADRARSLNQGDMFSAYVAARVADQRGDTSNAVRLIEEAIQIEPDNAELYNAHAWMLISTQAYDKALANVNKALDLHGSSGAYDTRAWVYYFIGDYERAERDCQTAIRLDRSYTYHHALLYRVRGSRGEEDLATSEAQQALRSLPRDDRVVPVLEYYLGQRSIESLKSTYPHRWSDYRVATLNLAD